MTMPAFQPPPGFHHITVLREETVNAVQPRDGGVYLLRISGKEGQTHRKIVKF